MKRSPMPRRSRPLRAGKPVKPNKPSRRRVALDRSIDRHRYDTGPSPEVKAIVLVRSKGRCEVCGNYMDGPHSYHHRQPRQMGGSGHCDWINLPSNLLLVCGSATSPDGCHHLIESQRALAYANGWLVHRPERPAEIPVDLHGGLRYLDDAGNHVEGNP